MRILHILFEPPQAGGSGAQLRSRALGRALRGIGTVETLVLRDRLPPGAGPLPRRPSRIEAELPAELLEAATEAARALAPDLVVVETTRLADVVHRLADRGHRVVLDAHNVESTLRRQTDIARRGWKARLFYRRRWRRAAAAESAVLRRARAVWACSADDARGLRALAPDAALAVVPNPVPDWCESPLPPPAPGIAALFLGHLGYDPNIRAAERLARRILPQLRAAAPGARLTIAGRGPDPRCLALAGLPGLELRPDPAEVAPLYAGATMAIVPLTEGGGTRIKVLEAMACGRPVIASAKAVEGLGLTPGEHFLQAQSDAQFAEAALALGSDAGLRERVRQAALVFAQRHHGARAIDAAVARALDAMTERGATHG